ncbi:M23 family metallopeptidase [Reichenbachiella carrageenanivorans]|uniref:M23 family metallopeptidase n=1 Tax=Reichenbachiella carrageenanivorans TaxID=2979869 RepID=A0ABY6CW80_9BACT|nr:M23 family metallopeptidase [Reichenbachiella carrageenanivorans]UXX78160.1 M23 family metallopeptidase [Reichenbachiella carrageenanivorans]
MRLNKILPFLFFIVFDGLSQDVPQRGDFMFPVRPRQENYLAGSMGELRSSHFHTGLDIKTSGITGLPIYASADGYIQRIRVSLGGYGNALYLAHPETGAVTVYAHLKSFNDEIAEYVRTQQYAEENFQVDLYPAKNQFSYKKGEIIALSGNSGSSSGPHLHFEVRTLSHRALDPLDYGFDEIVDSQPPVLASVAFVTMDADARINGMYGRVEFDVVTDAQGNASIPEGISLFGNIGVEVYAYDQFDGARNRNGIRFQTLMLDGKPAFSQQIDKLNFGLQRNILVHTNYKRSQEGGRRFNKLYVDHGNGLRFYETNEQSGVLRIYDPLEHRIDIRLEDAYGNINQVNIKVNDNGFSRSRDLKHTYALDSKGFDVMGHLLEIESTKGHCDAIFYLNGNPEKVDMAYYTNTSHHYLWDLRNGLPDSAQLCEKTISFNLAATIPSEQKITWEGEGIRIVFPKYALFDTAYLHYQKRRLADSSEVFELDNAVVPLRQFITVHLKPTGVYDMLKSGVYALDGRGGLGFVGGDWEGDEMVFKTRDLVAYTIATDSIPPVISQKVSRKGRLKFKIEDKMSGIHSVRATLNGAWLLMHFDAKSGYIWTDEWVDVSGQFSLAVKDNANNITRFEATY